MTEDQYDQHYMQEALQLGQQARFRAPPNPWVGCVIAKGSQLLGRGSTQAPGGAHAEIKALQEAGQRAQGATVYVTLEPCAHHGRTGPCCVALAQAEVARVVIALEDPDPQVAGKGISYLREQGIEVSVGLESEAAKASLRPYLHQRSSGRPWVLLKTAISLDGRTAATDGSSKWISGELARGDAHRLRDASQAILVGSGTALADRPALTIRHVPQQSPQPPLRVLLDGKAQVPIEGPLFDTSLGETVVVTGGSHPWPNQIRQPNYPDLPGLLDELGQRGLLQLMIEGGAGVHARFLESGLVNEIVAYIGPKLLGSSGLPMLQDFVVESITDAVDLHLIDVTRLGDTLRLNYLL